MGTSAAMWSSLLLAGPVKSYWALASEAANDKGGRIVRSPALYGSRGHCSGGASIRGTPPTSWYEEFKFSHPGFDQMASGRFGLMKAEDYMAREYGLMIDGIILAKRLVCLQYLVRLKDKFDERHRTRFHVRHIRLVFTKHITTIQPRG